MPLSLDTRFKILLNAPLLPDSLRQKTPLLNWFGSRRRKWIRIRSAQLRGFASLNYCVSVKPPAAKPCAIFPPFAKENNPQKTRVLLFVSPLRVFSFALFGLLASGSALGGSPV
ncbi:MAG: hypothetical protein H0X49_08045, partial [Acidobacteria bacterium]|nr:hypothetical protein [Acidobacteriota bacterium]